MLNNYNTIDIAIDLHRDGRELNEQMQLTEKEHERMSTTTINGEKVAKFFFVVGMKKSKCR